MKMLFLRVGWVALILIGMVVRPVAGVFARPEHHEPVKYYGSWDGYLLPLRLSHKITKEEADARAARGAAYLVGYFDPDGRLVRDIKIYQGTVFFAHEYTYYPSGRLKTMKVTNTRGEVLERQYAESDQPMWVW